MKIKAMKEIIKTNKFPLNLQFFAEDGGDGGAGDDGGDDGEDGGDDGDDDADSDADKNTEDKKKFTQADIDAAVAKRLAKERKKMPTQEELTAFREYQKKQKAAAGDDDNNKDDEELKKAQEENSKLATKVMCLERGVLKENIEDVTALAMSYVDDENDIEDAIDKVLKKYPTFTKKPKDDDEEDDEQKGGRSWGQRQEGKGAPKLTGVERAFYAKNPGLRPN